MPFANYTPSRFYTVRQAMFTENATSLTHTATFNLAAGSTLIDIYVIPIVLWTATTSAAFTCGDANSANGWFTSTDLKATDLILGERLQASQAVASDGSYGGTKEGSYLTTNGRFGRQTTTMIGGYCLTATTVIGVVTVVGPSATTGRTLMQVIYTRGRKVNPVLA